MKRKTIEVEISEAYEKGKLRSEGLSRAQLREFREAASATFKKDRRVNVRLSSPDLMDIQARAAEEGIPYQTLIASVIHKFVSGRFEEKPSRLTTRSSGRAKKRRAA
jgi:predicted DNA binding CopG/RHH family protein